MMGTKVQLADLRRVKSPPKVVDDIYTTPRWKALRTRVRIEAQGRCEAPGCTSPGYHTDHKIELRDGGAPFDRSNVWLLCSRCHGQKTVQERAKRMKA